MGINKGHPLSRAIMLSLGILHPLVSSAFLIYLLNRPEGNNLSEEVDPDPPPGFSRDEIKVLFIIGFTSLLWLTDFLHRFNPAIPALLAAALLLSPGIGVLSWEESERSMS